MVTTPTALAPSPAFLQGPGLAETAVALHGEAARQGTAGCDWDLTKTETVGVPVHALLTAAADRAADAVLDFVEAGLAGPMSVTDLADVAGLSRFYFARAFHSAVGEPPLTYVTRRRVETACDLLRRTKLPVAEVAKRSGFKSPAYFSTSFRRRTGRSPSLYRQQS